MRDAAAIARAFRDMAEREGLRKPLKGERMARVSVEFDSSRPGGTIGWNVIAERGGKFFAGRSDDVTAGKIPLAKCIGRSLRSVRTLYRCWVRSCEKWGGSILGDVGLCL